jgi:predicted ATPase
MHIDRFKLYNFKSFLDSPPVKFSPGLNVVVGQNNAGKSALLEALGLNPAWTPHKSPKTVAFEGAFPDRQSITEVSFSVSRKELLEILSSYSTNKLILPYPDSTTDFARSINYRDESTEAQNRLADWFLSQDRYFFNLTRLANEGAVSWMPTLKPSFGGYKVAAEGMPRYQHGISYDFRPPDKLVFTGPITGTNAEIGVQLVESFRSRIYVFRAERFKIGEHPVGDSPVLAADASNLPAVLNVLQGQKTKFERFNKVVHSILPQVPWVSVRQIVGRAQVSEIVVWPFAAHPERQDLAVPIKDCGTGVSQVLAIVYVVISSSRPSVIVIDEPQSFLHPGAARKLIDVLKDHPQHQYIIATHSPSIISVADTATITLARLTNGETVLEQLDAKDARAQRALLADLGARLSDVFGSDKILWVEGLTEEICYKRIHQKFAGSNRAGTVILGVRNTGDLDGDSAERMLEIYNKISSSNSLIPPAVGFIFDRECRSEQQQKELITKSRNLLHFIPRRMYENYLLDEVAIAAVANAIENFSPTQISGPAVSLLLTAELDNPLNYCDRTVPSEFDAKILAVHGKCILKSIFAELSESRVEYREVEHGSALTEWLLANRPQALEEIHELMTRVLDSGT